MKIRKGGRRAIKLSQETKDNLFREYDEDILSVKELMHKYKLSRYIFYKTMRERRANEQTEIF